MSAVNAANDEIHRLCAGGQWRMRVPVDMEHDSDMVLTAALDELTAERDRARATAVALEQQLARVADLAIVCAINADPADADDAWGQLYDSLSAILNPEATP